MFHIVVCMKIIADPEMPLSIFKVDRAKKKPIPPEGTPPVFSPFDENALEAALKIKDVQDCKITVLSIGSSIPKVLLQKVLALGADAIVAIEDPKFENIDPFHTSEIIANSIEKMNHYDLIFTGRQSADWDAGMVWAGIAEVLDIPAVTIARKAKIYRGKVIVERCVTDGIEIIESDIPALVSFSNEVGELRYASLPALMKVKKREIQKRLAQDIDYNGSKIMDIQDLYLPDFRHVECFMIQGENNKEKGCNLAQKLIDEDII